MLQIIAKLMRQTKPGQICRIVSVPMISQFTRRRANRSYFAETEIRTQVVPWVCLDSMPQPSRATEYCLASRSQSIAMILLGQ